MRELWLNIAHTGGARVYGLAVNTLILAITARWLGPEGRGVLGATTTWVGLFATVGCLSLGQVAIHHAVGRRDEEWLPSALGSLLALAGIVTIAGWATAAACYWATGGNVFGCLPPSLLAVGFLMLPFLVWEQYGSSLLMAVDRLKIYNNAQLAARTASVGVLLAALTLDMGIVAVLVVTLAAQAIVASAGLRELFRRAGGAVRPCRKTTKSLLAGGLKLHLNTVGSFLIISSSVLVIHHVRGATEAGYYQLAVQLIGALAILPTAACMVLYGRVTRRGPDAAWAEQRRVFFWLSLGTVVAAAAGIVAGPWVIPLVGGPSFAPAVRPFQWLLPTLLGMTFSAVMGPQWIGRGLFWQASALTMAVGLLSVGLSLAFTPQYGYWGAVWGMWAAYGVSILTNGIMAAWCEMRYRRDRSTTEAVPPSPHGRQLVRPTPEWNAAAKIS